jgi:hypothetical protein
MARPRRTQIWDDWLAPAPARAPELVPIFGPKTFDATTTCQAIHPRGAIPSGYRCVCMSCHRSGVDHRVRDHVKPGNGQLRDGWDAPEPTRYLPPPPATGKAPLRGGIGR